MIDGWKKIRHRLEHAGVALLAAGIPKLSRGSCVRLSKALGALAFHLDARGRAVALENLSVAFGDRYSPGEREEIARRSYQTFARTMIDLFWAPRLTPATWADYIKIENEQAFAQAMRERRGALVLISHHGNFEWAHMSLGFAFEAGTGVQETFKNPLLTELFTALRAAAGTLVVEQDRSMLRLFKQLKRGGIAGLLIDLTLRPDQPSAVIEGFGLKMCVTFMHAELHRRTRSPLFALESIPQDDGTCRVIVHGPFEFDPEMPAHEITQACWDFFEPKIRDRPELWMWAYKHWRYRPADTGGRAYPSYANPSKNFEKLCRAQRAVRST